jgi:hypothetical protein
MRITSILLGAFLAIGAAACGKVSLPGSSGDGDGGSGDGDGGGSDAAGPGPVTVTVLSFDGRRTPVEGAQVAFFAASGEHQATVDTDDEGRATSDLAPGGAVVAFGGDVPTGSASLAVRAVLGVEPGDQIVIGGEPYQGGSLAAEMTITLPVLTGAASYIVYTPCGTFSSGNNVVPLTFYQSCDVDSFAYVALASGDAGPSFAEEDEAAVIPGGNYDATATWQMTPTRPFRFTGVPDEALSVEVGVSGVRTGDQQLDLFLTRDEAPAGEEMLTLRPERIPGYDETLIYGLVRAEQPSLGTFQFTRWMGADDSTDTDLADVMLPWMGPVALDTASRSLRWRIVGAGEYDATYVTVNANINDGDTFLETTWFVVAPPGIEEIVLPELPAELSEYYLPDPENVYAYGQIVESSEVEGYAGARQRGFDLSYFPRLEPLGSVTRSSFSGAPGGDTIR